MGRVVGVVLVGIGAFLVTLAPLLRFPIADRLIAAPADQYRVTTLEAEDAEYFSAGDLKVLKGDLNITVTTKGDVRGAEGDRVVWEQFTSVNDKTNNRSGIVLTQFRGAFDKYTGEGVNCCDAKVDDDPVVPSGQVFLFPFHAEKRTYKVFNPVTGRSYDAHFAGEETVNGLPVYRYEQIIPATRIDTIDAPAAAMGMDGSGDVRVERWYDAKITYWVEPVSGAPVKQEQRRHEVLKTADGVERKPAFVATARYTPESVDDMVRAATDAKNQILMLTVWMPATLLVGGLVLLLAGVVFVLRGGRSAAPAAG